MSSDIAIKGENLSKCYQIYGHPRERLKQFFLPHLRRIAGREPNNYYREFWALSNVSFEIKKGETVGIVGQNGSGKSTLLQMICGILNPTSGSIQTDGRIAALLELGSGFNPEFTGRENVYMNAALLGLSKTEIDARFDDIAAFADIGDFIEQPVKTYSSGMYVRLAFAVQASIDPDIFIVDEALAVGDERFQRKCFARIEALKAKGTAILFVSHSPEVVIQLCDKVMLLEGGRHLLSGIPTEVVKAYQRLIYAPDDIKEALILEMGNTSIKHNDRDEENWIARENEVMQADCMDIYDPSFIPESTVSYPLQGAKINSIEILNPAESKVNIITGGNKYDFVVQGQFLDDCEAVFFGVHIKNISGIEIAGQRYPAEGKTIPAIKRGETFKMIFHFNLMLMPGTYFVGGGVWSATGPTCLHRILDASMFKVLANAPVHAFGNCNLEDRLPELQIA